MSITYHGNFPSLVNNEFVQHVLNTEGELRPHDHEEEEEHKRDQILKWKEACQDWGGVEWHMYYYKELGLTSPADLYVPDYFNLQGSVNWWFVKINPCKMFPMHVDAFETHSKNFRRLWIPVQDYVEGHVFIYEGTLVKDYKAGDVYEFTNPRAWHGAANLSMVPKITLQIVAYD